MQLYKAFALLADLRLAVQSTLFPTIIAILRDPLLLFRPAALSRLFMANVWVAFGDGIDEEARPMKERLIPGNARGVVLDLGAGHGHTIKYLDREKVTKYIALEPNQHMHPKIRQNAANAGFSEAAETLLILPYGAEETSLIVSALGGPHAVDTIISILALCTIPSPETSLRALIDQVLKPGGHFLFYEHVLSPREDVAWWQRFWTPLWKRAFDGCCLDRPTHIWVPKMNCWQSAEVSAGRDDENDGYMFWHRVGIFVKK